MEGSTSSLRNGQQIPRCARADNLLVRSPGAHIDGLKLRFGAEGGEDAVVVVNGRVLDVDGALASAIVDEDLDA